MGTVGPDANRIGQGCKCIVKVYSGGDVAVPRALRLCGGGCGERGWVLLVCAGHALMWLSWTVG